MIMCLLGLVLLVFVCQWQGGSALLLIFSFSLLQFDDEFEGSRTLTLEHSFDQGNMSGVMRKPNFCLCENKGTDQLYSNCTADQRLCLHYLDSTIILLFNSEISSSWCSSATVQVSLCLTCSEIPMTSFLASWLI